MSAAAQLTPIFAVIILLLGAANSLSIQLILVGILAIAVHTALSPVNPYGSYPNFDKYHPEQPSPRDYVLVFGLAGLVLVALFSRIQSLVSTSVTYRRVV